ncbi:hypothetical protein P43SY_005002 [Pythium insidiosum]|uniref:Peptidase S33 tripeptidyl aminopeptidase-like C-terminal domain-containing protein n=1 Tax=Pythium insidiosum TaxID=114742 RepID=A0AAD5Q9R8_PYTIN|nr:hypothetical protein P43SY_005002 [Pythium insidiosum]
MPRRLLLLLLLALPLALPLFGAPGCHAQAPSLQALLADATIKGWYPCSAITFVAQSPLVENDPNALKAAQCAVVDVPLCYPGVCNGTTSQTIELFVKRIVASTADPSKRPNVWFLQGGPGASSVAMESAMLSMYRLLRGQVNVYTMDHRGTGRSTKLDCVAAQATTSGSPRGTSVSPSEVPACADELKRRYRGNLAGFSTTSAAYDLAAFISSFQARSETYVYGVSYGSSVVERLMHLQPKEVVGYVLDGVSTTAGADKSAYPYFSNWDTAFGAVGERLLELCASDTLCKSKFGATPAKDALRALLTDLDGPSSSRCAAIIADDEDVESPPAGVVLRIVLGEMLQSASLRALIPAVVYRVQRCAERDQTALKRFFKVLRSMTSRASEDSAHFSSLLYRLIMFSELWEAPTPSSDELLERFLSVSISNGAVYSSVDDYCAFTKETSSVCRQLGVSAYTAPAIWYARDRYWNVAATVPPSASVLLMSSQLDPQTPHTFAETLLQTIKGSRKALVTFDYAAHGTVFSTKQAGSGRPTCGMQVLVSYVAAKGDVTKIDRTCVASLPGVNFSASPRLVADLFDTSDAFDGVVLGTPLPTGVSNTSSAAGPRGPSNSTSSRAGDSASISKGDSSSHSSTATVFIVLFVVTLVASVVFAVLWRTSLLQLLPIAELELELADDVCDVWAFECTFLNKV